MPISSVLAFRQSVNEAFKTATEIAQSRSAERRKEVEKELSKYLKILRRLGEHSCGACWALGKGDEEHTPYHCPWLNKEVDIPVFEKLRDKISYPKKWSGPCYTCHIHSMGSDILHEAMEVGAKTCDRRDIMLPMLTVIWTKKHMRNRMMQLLDIKEMDLDQYIKWLSTPNSSHHSGSMELLLYVEERKLF